MGQQPGQGAIDDDAGHSLTLAQLRVPPLPPLPWRKKKKREQENSLYLMFGGKVLNGHSNIDDDNKF